MCVFVDRPGLVNTKHVESLQEIYLNALMSYVKLRRSTTSQFLAKLLLKLVDLRTLSTNHTHVLHSLRIQRGSLPPLLNEYFDVFD